MKDLTLLNMDKLRKSKKKRYEDFLERLGEQVKDRVMYKKGLNVDGLFVVTDKVEYSKKDQVFPLHPENLFYLNEMIEYYGDKIKGANVLEIGLGSGILSMSAAQNGAERVTALEINPRAKVLAGFNIFTNGLEDRIDIKDGNTKDIFKPVESEKFDYIISNPPFEPTPIDIENYLHSSGGMYGLDFVEKIFKELDEYLTNKGHAQIVTFAPGDEKKPTLLIDLVNKYLDKGSTNIKVNLIPIKFDYFVNRFAYLGSAKESIKEMKDQAKKDGISHLYLCMVHYEKGDYSLKVELTKEKYKNWDLPLASNVPMGYKN